MKSNLTRACLTALAPLIWGTTYIAVTELLPDRAPLTVAAMRVLPAGLLLIAVGWLRSRWRPRGREWRRHALIAVFNFTLFFPLLVVATYRLPGGIVGAAGGAQPLFVSVLGALLAGTRPARRELVIGGVAAIGVVLVVGRSGVHFDIVGVLATFAATLSFAVGVVLTKRFPPPPDRIAATGWQLTLSAILLVPLAVLTEGVPAAPTIAEAAGFAYLSVAATGVAFILWFSGIEHLPASVPPLLGLAAPLTGATIGWIALGQSLGPLQMVGFMATIGSIVIGVRHPAPTATTCPTANQPHAGALRSAA